MQDFLVAGAAELLEKIGEQFGALVGVDAGDDL